MILDLSNVHSSCPYPLIFSKASFDNDLPCEPDGLFQFSVFQQIPFLQNNPAISVVFNGVLIIVVIKFYPGGLIRLVNTFTYKIKVKINTWKQRRREYKYGVDSE